jgi:hypothetical protein
MRRRDRRDARHEGYGPRSSRSRNSPVAGRGGRRDGSVTGQAVGDALRLRVHSLNRGESDAPNCALPSSAPRQPRSAQALRRCPAAITQASRIRDRQGRISTKIIPRSIRMESRRRERPVSRRPVPEAARPTRPLCVHSHRVRERGGRAVCPPGPPR